MSQDSCDQQVGIAESKNSSSWNWFLEKLSSIIQINNEETIIFQIGEKDIINSVNNISPLSSKAYCVRHMCKNFRVLFRNKRLKVLFWQMVNTYLPLS